ncbi:MAG: methyltransferase domain-containing protein [Oligoflexia bacterium]|nr:methyltransferase domain-containing protein [Oligoflexia bacterium]
MRRARALTDVQRHYDRLALLYRVLWGEHVHHGYWGYSEGRRDGDPPWRAQLRLIEKLVDFAGIGPGAAVLDVGCGTGGSAFWLAENLRSHVLGINISPVQLGIAREQLKLKGLEEQVRFARMDAGRMEFEGRFDVIWTIECVEHLQDKPRFFASAARLLKPGGVLAMATWLAGPAADTPKGERLLAEIREAMLCPSLPGAQDTLRALGEAGFSRTDFRDISKEVAPTWGYCVEIVERPGVKTLSRVMGDAVARFVDSFELMIEGYSSRALAYGIFAARKASAGR